MIPSSAVEAAARVIVRTVVDRSWDSLLPSRQEWYRAHARAALEAAAPHMLAGALASIEALCEEATSRGIESGPPLTLSAIRDALRPNHE